jgi:hypothetical protein
MTKNIDLVKKKKNLSYKKSFCENSSHVLLYLSLTSSLDKNDQRIAFWHYLFLWNAIYEHISWLLFAFDERFQIDAKWVWILSSFLIIFFYLRLHFIENILNQLFYFFILISDSLR